MRTGPNSHSAQSTAGTGHGPEQGANIQDCGPVRQATQAAVELPERRAPLLADLNALPPTLAVEAAGRILGCGRSLAYDLVRRGEFPCRVLRVGRRYLIPTADLLDVLGVHPSEPPA